ncbi:MAG: leucyl aminopeptidase [Pseudomonadota bacterium]
MELEICQASPFEVEASLVAVGLLEASPPALPAALAEHFDAALAAHVAAESFTGRAESSLILPSLGHLPAARLMLVGLGRGGADELRAAAGLVGQTARKKGDERVVLDFSAASPGAAGAAAIVEGFSAGNYAFDRHKAASKRKAGCGSLRLVLAEEGAGALPAARIVAEAQGVVRDLVNEPAEVVYPETLAAFAASLASDRLEVTVWDERRIEAEGMGGLYAVGKGSARPPRFVHMHYRPAGEAALQVALVGKGVTFDAGGLSLKPNDGLDTMRCDMAGAATVIGLLQAIDHLGLAVEVHGIFGAAENMNSGSSFKHGDVLTMFNGKTVEVHNTDAEGRLVLADCLAYASKLGVAYCLDLATLTGACVVALGSRYTGLFTEDDELAAQLLAAAEEAGDGLWRLPLAEHFKKLLEAEWADLNHMGPRWGGASSAAAFLSAFVDGPRWAHLDIAGPAFLEKPERYYGKGATGAMLRAVLVWLQGRIA